MGSARSDPDGGGADYPEEEVYRSAVEASPDPILVYDLAGRILWVNHQTLETFGVRTREELLARMPTVFHFLGPVDAERARARFSKTLSEGRSSKSEYEVTIGGGRKLTVEINSSVVRNAAGQPRAFVSVVRDVSERKQLERHLATQKQLAELLAAAESREEALRICLDAAIAHSEADCGAAVLAGPDRTLKQVATAGFLSDELASGVELRPDGPQAEALFRGKVLYLHSRDWPGKASELAAAEGIGALAFVPVTVADEVIAGFAVMSHHHDELSEASKRWVESVGAQLGGVLGRLASIEEKRRVEDRLQQAMKMEAVGRLAGGVAHDFNNLLTAIIGNLSLALLDLSPRDPLHQSLTEATGAAESAADLVKQLLAFSRKQIIEPRVFDLNELLRRLSRLIERLIGEDIALVVRPSDDACRILADPGQMEQILANLSVNARDAMPRGGTLVLETSVVTLGEAYCASHVDARPGAFVMLAVSDTGAGIPEEVRPHLFEPFFTTKGKGHGTGLGLATTYGIVKQAGGSIEVFSEVGRGTSFKLYLPRVDDAPSAGLEPRDAAALPPGRETLLVVEDEAFVRNLATQVLRRLGYHVLVAKNGEEALALAAEAEGPIDLLMTDVVMPGMNGRQLAERLREGRPGLKVLYTSGYTENVIVHHGVVDEGVRFLAKPYLPDALARKLRQLLDEEP